MHIPFVGAAGLFEFCSNPAMSFQLLLLPQVALGEKTAGLFGSKGLVDELQVLSPPTIELLLVLLMRIVSKPSSERRPNTE